ncbi:telomerase reverse transcriptase isoform X2 [Pseudorasbora parva]|uniref:telomerase reverse transcriptase isoform X2 n=1 Tax=Pseudorasbora parva TaxID=51549 RepID=UPI00351DD66D
MSRRDATDGGFKYVFGILRSLYPVVQTLEEFTDGLVFSDGRKPLLLEESDGTRFKNLVRGLMICSFTPPQQQRVPAQLSTLPEVLAFVLNHIKRKKLRNVLGFGYQCHDVTASSDPFRFHGDVSQTAASISTSEVWKRINQRLGTEITRHLLTDCAVFATVPPSCLLQVCGRPLYDLLLPRSSSGFFLSHVSPKTRKNPGVPLKPAARDEVKKSLLKKRARDDEKETISRKRARVDEKETILENRVSDDEKETISENRARVEEKETISENRARVEEKETISKNQARVEEKETISKNRARVEEKETISENRARDDEKETLSEKRARDDEKETLSEKRARDDAKETLSVKRARDDEKGTLSEKRARDDEKGTLSEKRVRDDEKDDKLPVSKRRRDESQSFGSHSWKPSDQRPPRPSHCAIRVLSMLYNGRGMKNFLLNRKLKDVGGARRLQGAELVRIIFLQSDFNGAHLRPKKLPKRFFSMVPLFNRLLRKHRKCPYALFLHRKCSANPDAQDMKSLLKSHVSAYRVYLFVRDCLLYVFPEEIWGSLENRLHFLSNVKNFLRLGKFERLPLVQLMWKMKVQACHWLGVKKRQCPSEHRYREWIFGQFLAWTLSGFVVGLVRALFYVTESMGQKHTLHFYRAEVWHTLQETAFSVHLSKGQWRALSPSQAVKFPKSSVCSRIRFIPKIGSMRPITRLTGSRESLQHFQSCVRVLLNVLSVCVREAPGPMGSTVWGWRDIHRVLRDFSPQQKSSPRPLYFVKVDVSGAYDSLPHQKLMEVLGEVLSPFAEQSFFLRQYARVWKDPIQGLRKHFCTKAEMCEPLNMKGFVVDEQASGSLRDSVLVERHSSEVRGADVFQFFQKMLSSFVIHHENKMFRQVCGIPQGSSVSALLCNLCYGHMENALFKGIDKGGCLMRLVDDFLLITPHLSKATEFLTTLLAGVPDYGCKINPQKVAVNFPVCEEWVSCGVCVFPSGSLFPWCGLLLHTHTLDVYKDYSRYDGLSLRYSLTLGSAHSPAAVMKKLLSVLSLKCTDIFLDLRMNSVEAVYRSLYKLILLQALRFHACVKSFPLGQNVATNPSFFLKMIWTMARVTNKLIRHTNTGLVVGGVCGGGVLQYEAVQLMFCLAFATVCTQNRPVYRTLLPPLHKRRRRLQRALRGIRLARVHQAATPRIPQDFKSIRT